MKSGKDRATFYADSFAAGLMCALVGMEKASKALKRELEACTKDNADLQEKRDAAEARKGAILLLFADQAPVLIFDGLRRGRNSAGRGTCCHGVGHHQGGRRPRLLRAEWVVAN